MLTHRPLPSYLSGNRIVQLDRLTSHWHRDRLVLIRIRRVDVPTMVDSTTYSVPE